MALDFKLEHSNQRDTKSLNELIEEAFSSSKTSIDTSYFYNVKDEKINDEKNDTRVRDNHHFKNKKLFKTPE